MLVELGTAFELAEEDDGVRVVILRGAGSCFSAGHDLGSTDDVRERSSGPPGQHPSYLCNGGTLTGADARHRQEWHYFFSKKHQALAQSAEKSRSPKYMGWFCPPDSCWRGAAT